jgi:hypothetical protein
LALSSSERGSVAGISTMGMGDGAELGGTAIKGEVGLGDGVLVIKCLALEFIGRRWLTGPSVPPVQAAFWDQTFSDPPILLLAVALSLWPSFFLKQVALVWLRFWMVPWVQQYEVVPLASPQNSEGLLVTWLALWKPELLAVAWRR